MKVIVSTDQAAAPRGAYPQAVVAGDILYLSGQIGLKGTEDGLPATLEEQVRQIFVNIRGILSAKNADFSNLLTMTCYLAENQEWAIFNRAYGECLGSFDPPARTTVTVKALPLGALAEITAVAILNP